MSRSRKGTSSSPSVGSRTPDVAKELEELREATRLAHEVLRDLKEERKGLQQDKRELSLVRTEVEASIAEAKQFIEKDIMMTVSTALANNLQGGKVVVDEVIKELGDMMVEFRDGRDILLGKTIKKLEENKMPDKAQAIQEIMERKFGSRLEMIVIDLDGDDNPTISTFGNGEG